MIPHKKSLEHIPGQPSNTITFSHNERKLTLASG